MGSLTLPHAARLLRPADFTAVRRRGQRVPMRWFHVETMPSERAIARMGLAVSRRVSKKAVVRNRIKRVVRESFRAVRADLPLLDILVIPRPRAAEQDNAVLRADLVLLWQRLRALKPDAGAGTMRA